MKNAPKTPLKTLKLFSPHPTALNSSLDSDHDSSKSRLNLLHHRPDLPSSLRPNTQTTRKPTKNRFYDSIFHGRSRLLWVDLSDGNHQDFNYFTSAYATTTTTFWAWAIGWRCSLDGRFLLPVSLPGGSCQRGFAAEKVWKGCSFRWLKNLYPGSVSASLLAAWIWHLRLKEEPWCCSLVSDLAPGVLEGTWSWRLLRPRRSGSVWILISRCFFSSPYSIFALFAPLFSDPLFSILVFLNLDNLNPPNNLVVSSAYWPLGPLDLCADYWILDSACYNLLFSSGVDSPCVFDQNDSTLNYAWLVTTSDGMNTCTLNKTYHDLIPISLDIHSQRRLRTFYEQTESKMMLHHCLISLMKNFCFMFLVFEQEHLPKAVNLHFCALCNLVSLNWQILNNLGSCQYLFCGNSEIFLYTLFDFVQNMPLDYYLNLSKLNTYNSNNLVFVHDQHPKAAKLHSCSLCNHISLNWYNLNKLGFSQALFCCNSDHYLLGLYGCIQNLYLFCHPDHVKLVSYNSKDTKEQLKYQVLRTNNPKTEC